MTDSLDRLLEAQVIFQESLTAFAADKEWTDPQTGNVVSGHTIMLIDNAKMAVKEAGEIEDLLPWKKHKREYGRPVTQAERDKALEENVDLLHFVINIFLLLGITTSDEIVEAFFRKNEVNHQRQKEGY